MMNNPAMKEAMAKVGGADGLADLMKNPQMLAMAQKMMKDPKVRTHTDTDARTHTYMPTYIRTYIHAQSITMISLKMYAYTRTLSHTHTDTHQQTDSMLWSIKY